ncbi:MAG: chemotaxis protein CheA [Burkholderiales bacterium]|nr:chemotaxis protein CheA [Burkholderiales bacterium]
MSAFANCLDILDDFLVEAGDLLEDVDRKLVALESAPSDGALLNDIFRGFHTIKGGGGFLEATPLVDLCHKTENLFDQLRSGKMQLSAELLDLIMAATGEVRRMFAEMAAHSFPEPAPTDLLAALAAAMEGRPIMTAQAGTLASGAAAAGTDAASSAVAKPLPTAADSPVRVPAEAGGMPDWAAYLAALTGMPVDGAPGAARQTAEAIVAAPSATRAARPVPKAVPAPASPQNKDNSIRIETGRFDHILNLTGEIGLTTNRLKRLKSLLVRSNDRETQIRQLEKAVSQLDMMVDDLRSAVMKARMQPVGRVFQKYSRLARDLSRSLGKDVDLALEGEETEVDKTILDELNDPLVHLVRNAIDHGVEPPAERIAAGKSARARVTLSAQQVGDQLMIQIRDDGRGMKGDVIRQKALEKGLLEPGTAASLTEAQCLKLIFLPGFSTKDQITDVSGRGVGMDVVQTNIRKLGGRIDITSAPGEGSTMTILLPLTLAILPVLMIRLGEQPLALPLSTVREILPLDGPVVQRVSGKPTVVLRGEVMPYHCLATLLGRSRPGPAPVGVLIGSGDTSCVIGVDGFMGQDEVMIKPLEGVKPRGVSGATLSGDGELVLLLELRELMGIGRLVEPLNA